MAEEKDGWNFDEGAEIAPGRSVLKTLGGGSRYEVLLVWDDRLFAITVAKVLRPEFVEDERALGELAEEADALAQLAHPVLVRGFDAVLDGPHPHVLIEHLEGPTLRRLPPGWSAPHGAAASAGRARGGRSALHERGGLGPPRREAGQHRDGCAPAPDRPEHRAHARTGPALTCSLGTDPYMAPEQCETDANAGASGPPPTSGAWRDPPSRADGTSALFFLRGDSDPMRFPQLEQPPLELPRFVCRRSARADRRDAGVRSRGGGPPRPR